MFSQTSLVGALTVTNLWHFVLAAPTSQASFAQDVDHNSVSAASIRPREATGSIYGSETLLGPDGNLVNPADTTAISDYQLVPGQDEDQNVGLYLDFTNIVNPQPIKAMSGGTDPGPRKYSSILVHG